MIIGIIGIIVSGLGIILIIASLIVGLPYYNSDVLTKAGYQSKVIGITCLVYHGNRWVSCDSVLNNQIELVKQE